MPDQLHTVWQRGQWTNVHGFHDGLELGRFDSKDAAVSAGRQEAERLRIVHVVHDEAHAVETTHDYSSEQR